WAQSESYFNQAERLDPRNANLLTQHVLSYLILRQFPEASHKLDEVLNLTPHDMDTIALKAMILQAEGNLAEPSNLLLPLRPRADDTFVIEARTCDAILERNAAEVINRLKEILAKPDAAPGYFGGELRFWLGWAQEIASDEASAQESWRQAKNELEGFLITQP